MILIKEDFLHYLWKYKYFVANKLQTTDNLSLQILNVGQHNLNSGPDFFNARLKVGDYYWAGNVEIHIKSSDWYNHHHEKDENYDNVILHVVWIHDAEVYDQNNDPIPTLELNKLVSDKQINQYQKLFARNLKWINCENLIENLDSFTLNNWLEVLYFERLKNKSILVQDLLQNTSNDWEAVLFKMLAKNFGLKVNGDAFLNLANSFDFKIIRKEQGKLINLESILLGQAGFLNDQKGNSYHSKLQQEYQYIQKKYALEPLNNGQFQFFRLRPHNFPTVRLAQLAKLYVTHKNLFSDIINAEYLQDVYALFAIEVSGFWQDHYSFTSKSVKRIKSLTKPFIDLLIINTIIPLKFVYFKQFGNFQEEPILKLIKQLKPENNSIINNFRQLFRENSNSQMNIENAFKSQSLLQLKNDYCNAQKCLYCAIGNSILNK